MVKYSCKVCAYKATTPGNLYNHVQVQHKLEKKYKCHICSKEYKHLEAHVKKTHDGDTIDCAKCRKPIKSYNINRHMKMHHSVNQTLYHCQLCTYNTIWKKYLEKHSLKVHQKTKENV